MRSHFDGDSIGRNLLKGLIEEDWRASIVDMVISRAEQFFLFDYDKQLPGAGQVGLPISFGDGSGDPTR